MLDSHAALLADLTGVAERLTERHYESCKPWYPHEVVPWDMARTYRRDEQWDPQEVPLPDPVRSALFVNLLTEDNLPYYFQTIDRMFGREGVWREWSHRWTAEEARHSIALRDFAVVTRVLDARALEDGRMAQMSGGEVPDPPSPVDGFVYVALQELATRIAHRNTGRALVEHLGQDHPVAAAGYEVIGRVATDENFHFLFYRDLTSAALEIAPSVVLPAIERQVRDFEMPGTGIPGFRAHAESIARAGLYNLQQHYDQILVPVVLTAWRVEALTGLNTEAEHARDALLSHLARNERVANRLRERSEAALSRR